MRLRIGFPLFVVGCLVGIPAAQAVTRVVATDAMGTAINCNAATPTPYTTINAAIGASSPGDTIVVCPATYVEQLTITIPLTVMGWADGLTVVQSPLLPFAGNTTSLATGAPIAAHALVDGTTGVVLQNLNFDGNGHGLSGCGAARLIGVYYRNASGTVRDCVVENYRLGAGSEGCQTGLGIFVQADGVGGTASVQALTNSVHDFQKNGITCNEVGATLTATGNVVQGDGPTPHIAQNGIQIGFGAGGVISGNTVTNVNWTPCTTPSSCAFFSGGMLVFDAAAGVKVTGNTVTNTQLAVYADSDGAQVLSNQLSQTKVWDGVYYEGTGATIKSNRVWNSDESGIFVNGTGNSVQANLVTETPIGIWDFGGAGNTIPLSGNSRNQFFDTGKKLVLGASPLVDLERGSARLGPATARPAAAPVRD